MVSVSASEPGGREFYPGLCSYSVFAIISNKFARQACGKLAASSFHGDFGAFVNLLQACTLVMTNLWQACCKLKLLSGMIQLPGHYFDGKFLSCYKLDLFSAIFLRLCKLVNSNKPS
ncbi:hypothetical protein AVEN_58977-1 [Araneus ventricosus]|uniref:Uncharacterized protein n=1 Tax=Araneus ventricosus TaxID=182803 RepID=A0A4Y2UXD0_ARAVE|nr:hypothetical protein AVEN_58977-1 [Araneus ventricosus]